MTLEPARPDDLDAIMRMERTPGYELFIGSFERPEHEANLVDPDWRYLVWRESGRAAAFVLFRRLTDPSLIVQAKRIAVESPGTGLSRRLLPAVIDWPFQNTDCNRLELDCSVENPRALRVYRREGFVEEGVVREVYRTADGRFVSSVLFSMLRREWEALPRRRQSG